MTSEALSPRTIRCILYSRDDSAKQDATINLAIVGKMKLIQCSFSCHAVAKRIYATDRMQLDRIKAYPDSCRESIPRCAILAKVGYTFLESLFYFRSTQLMQCTCSCHVLATSTHVVQACPDICREGIPRMPFLHRLAAPFLRA